MIGLIVYTQALELEQTQTADKVHMQLMRIREKQNETGVRLSGNPEFHNWLIENSRQEMPLRLEGFYNKLNKQNMKRRLYDIYKWQVGRSDANRSDYAEWLGSVADWLETQSNFNASHQNKFSV